MRSIANRSSGADLGSPPGGERRGGGHLATHSLGRHTLADALHGHSLRDPTRVAVSDPRASGGVIQGVLTRARQAKIEQCGSEEELVSLLRQELMPQRDHPLAESWARERVEYWMVGTGRGADVGLRDEIMRSVSLMLGFQESYAEYENAEDVAEMALNEAWHEGGGAAEVPALADDLTREARIYYYGFAQTKRVVQHKRKGDQETGPKDYATTNVGNYEGVSYKTSAKGGIEFGTALKQSTWNNPNLAGSLVDLRQDVNQTKHPKKGLTLGKDLVDIPTASRPQHFSMADRIYEKRHNVKPDREGKWTWHHLEAPYQMVLVDMTVHAKHGHNGGFLLWT